MYTAFFGLSEKPFTITPDPRYLYLSERHSEALAHLVFGIEESGGFIQLTGEVGTGKTTIVRTLLGELPDDVDVALILNPRLTVNEFLQTICEELKIKLAIGYPKIKPMIDALNAYLLEAHGRGRRTVLIVDEAQNLDPDVLEQVRLLTNLETTRQKLLQIILIGQTELQHTLARSDLRQLAQRITGRYHLEPLSRNETIGYIRHRMNIAGASRYVFTTSALKAVHRYSGGVPRLINVIADRALLGAYSKEQPTVSRSMVKAAAKEVGGIDMRARWLRVAVATAVAVGLASTAFWAGRELPLTAQSKDPEQTGLQATTVAIADPLSEPVLEQPFEQALETPIERFAEEPTESEVPVEAVATLIANNAGTGTDNAFEMMFGLWGADFGAADGRACDQATAQGLECVFQRGSWAHLMALNTPAILSLQDETGVGYQVVLKELDAENALLSIAGDEHRVTVDDLSDYWLGEYLILWRPPGAGEHFAPGMRNNGVVWLRESLADAGGFTDTISLSDFFDARLADQVREFQRAHGLRPDGIAGIRTLIALQSALRQPGRPLLDGDG